MSDLRVRDLVVEFIHDGYAVRPLDGHAARNHSALAVSTGIPG